MGYAVADAFLYALILSDRHSVKTLFLRVTMLTLELIMAAESAIYGRTKTILFELYPYIVSVIHICIILSLYNVKRAINNMVNYIGHVFRELEFLCDFAHNCYNDLKVKVKAG